MIDLLRIFTKVYECKNFTKAAELLFISQPTISLKMKQLEQELDVKLFVRQGAKSVQTTEQAEVLYKRAKEMLRFWDETTQIVTEQPTISLTIACSNTFALYYVPACITNFVKVFPQVDLTLNMVNSEEAVQAIEKYEADIALIEKPIATDGFQKELLFQDELVLAGVETGLWLMREEHSGLHYFNELYLVENGLTPRKIYANNTEMLRKLLRGHVGQTILPKIATKHLTYTTLPGKYKRNMYLVTQPRQPNHMMNEIITWVTAYFKEIHEK